MKILLQLITKELELSQEFLFNKYYKRAIWKFYCAYNLSLGVLGIKEKNFRKIKIYKKFLLKKINVKNFKKIKRYMAKDMERINEAVQLINLENEKLGFDAGDIYDPEKAMVGISSFEFPQ